MARRRFLRDGVIDDLINNVKEILDAVSGEEISDEFLFRYVNSLLISFQTNKLVLERIEESIEIARKSDPTNEICIPLADAAMHIQTGIITLHDSLVESISEDNEELDISDLSEEMYT